MWLENFLLLQRLHPYNTIFQQTMFDFQRAHNGTPTIPRRIGANVETQSYASCLYMKKKTDPSDDG